MRPTRSSLNGQSSSAKYSELAEKLSKRIVAGEWTDGKIPTVRDIAQEYGVSSFTASRALHKLQELGLIVTRNRSGSYIADPSQTVQETIVIILRVTPSPWKWASEGASLRGFEECNAGSSVKFVPIPFPVEDEPNLKSPPKVMKALLEAKPTGLVYLPSRYSEASAAEDRDFLTECRRLDLPVVLLDRGLRGETASIQRDIVTSDHFEGGRLATEHLLAIGRQRIACMVASHTTSHVDRLSGYLYQLEQYRLETGADVKPITLAVPNGVSVKESFKWVADQLRLAGADAIICYQDYTAMGVMLELMHRGVKIPNEVAIVGCDDLPLGDSFSIGLTTNTYPTKAMADWAVRLIHNRIEKPNLPWAKVMIPGSLIVRGSTVAEPG